MVLVIVQPKAVKYIKKKERRRGREKMERTE